MAKVVCSKCGITGISKCPYCRTVFPSDQYLAVVEYGIKFTDEGILFKRPDKGVTNEMLFRNIKCIVNKWDEKILSCEHVFVFAEGEVSSIGCGCK